MNAKFSPWLCAITCGAILFAQGLVAQTSIQLFGAVDTRLSQASASYSAPNIYSSSTLNLTCSTSPIVASLSGPFMNGAGTAPQLGESGALQAGGNLIVDNNLFVTVTPSSTGVAGPTTNVCTGFNQGGSYNGQTIPTSPTDLNPNCFTLGYGSAATGPGYPPGPLNGQDPDTYVIPSAGQTVDAVGGVAPIDISGQLVSGKQSVTIGLVDDGGIVTSSSVFLTTNCTQGGVTGPATVSGNTINSGDSNSLSQTFNFDTGNGQQVGFVYDVSGVTIFSANANGANPQTSDAPLNPTTFQPSYVPGTSFATSNCLIHTGELLSDGVTPACKLYTLACTIGTGDSATGAQCPVSDVANEVVQDIFDGPPFSLQNVYTQYGTFHEGIGFLMAADDWSASTGGPCTFDPASGLETLPCPQNLLTSFTGPGGFAGRGLTTNPNSTFISVYGVPEDFTSIFVPSEWPDHWSNTSTPKVYFSTQAPNFSKGAYVQSGNKLVALAGAAKYIPAPIKSITYGITPAGSPQPLPVNEPITGDLSLTPSTPCPAPLPTSKTEPNFVPAPVTLPSLPDGQYLLHYYAEDCAGTEELLFTQDPSQSWSTNFYTREINIDTTAPVVTGITLSPAGGSYKLNSVVNASYSCTDLDTGSGVVLCGVKNYATESTYSTSTLTTRVNTSSTGTKTFTVYAVDGAGNTSSKLITYTVTR
jgi:hypothetical protein